MPPRNTFKHKNPSPLKLFLFSLYTVFSFRTRQLQRVEEDYNPLSLELKAIMGARNPWRRNSAIEEGRERSVLSLVS